MSTFFMSNFSFSNFGIVIQQNINLPSISNSFSSLFGMPLSFPSLNVSFVDVAQVNGIAGITATGLGTDFLDGRLTVGDFAQFLPGTISAPSVQGFYHLSLTSRTIAAQGTSYDINQHAIHSVGNDQSLVFDTLLRSFDFSNTGTAALDVLMNRVSAQADPESADYAAFSDQEVIANAGRNIVYGYSGPGREDGYTGSNTYRLGGGNDIFTSGAPLSEEYSSQFSFNDQVRVFGGTGNDSISGGDKDDELYGEGGNDLLFGGPGNDLLVGGSGNDRLYASEGLDTLIGGTGADRFIFANNRTVEFDGSSAGNFLGFYTGGFVSPQEAPNRVADFNASENDLLVFGVESFSLASGFQQEGESGTSFILFPTQTNDGSALWQFEVFTSDFSDGYAFSGPAEVTLDHTLIQVESFAWSSFSSELDLATRVLDQNENGRDGSFEIVYGEGGRFGTAIGFGEGQPQVQIYRNLALAPSESTAGPMGGQDKFDLTALNLDDSELILTTLGVEQNFTLYDSEFLFTDEFSNSFVRAENFFLEEDDDERAIHAEYASYGNEGNTMVVYVDVNEDGHLDTRDDLVFRLDNILLSPDNNEAGFPDFAQELTAGQVDDLFILTQSQYSLWFI
jgi:hypothetical protein